MISKRIFPVHVVAFVFGLLGLSFIAVAAEPNVLADPQYRTACGPIARHLALRSIGVDQQLAESIQACQWKEGELTTLATLRDSLNAIEGVRASAVRISPAEVLEFIQQPGHAAILAIKKEGPEVDHVICALPGMANDHLIVVDYPELARPMPLSALAPIWDGEAILVSRDPPPPLSQFVIQATVPALLVGGLFWLVMNRSISKNQTVPVRTSSSGRDSLENAIS